MKTSALLDLELSLIDEDPDQPRREFDPDSLRELASTIRERGVKTPISVRKKGKRFLINHGARRFRASKLAKKKTIPAYIDEDYSKVDQVIENLHRDNLSAREIADFIGRELAQGKIKAQIAREIGKSAAYITQHISLLDLPDPITQIYTSKRCVNVSLINDLVTLFKRSPDDVEAWLTRDEQEISRYSIKLLRDFLEEKSENEEDVEDLETLPNIQTKEVSSTKPSKVPKKEGSDAKELLDQIHRTILKQKKSTRVSDNFTSVLSNDEKHKIETYLHKSYVAGKKNKNTVKSILKGLNNNTFSRSGSGAFSLIAFLNGANNGTQFNLTEILNSIKDTK